MRKAGKHLLFALYLWVLPLAALRAQDSLLRETLERQLKEARTSLPVQKPFLLPSSSYLHYNWSLQTNAGGWGERKNISQHLLTAAAALLLGRSLPLRLTYTGRETNNPAFRDLHDLRVEFDALGFAHLKAERMKAIVEDYAKKLRDSLHVPQLQLQQVDRYTAWLQAPEVVNKWLQCRERLLTADYLDSLHRDSLLAEARAFLGVYDSLRLRRDSLQGIYDSLRHRLQAAEKILRQGQQGLRNPLTAVQAAAVKTFALGRSTPAFSALTLENMSVNGLTIEYNRGNFYSALAAGSVRYRLGSFGRKDEPEAPQWIGAARLGYGRKEGHHLIATAYTGKKALFSGTAGGESVRVSGLSLAGRYAGKHITLGAEAAQSLAPPAVLEPGTVKKPLFRLKDRNSQAYDLQVRAAFPKGGTRLEGRYQYTGIRFQNFTGYKAPSTLARWSARAGQCLWKRRLHLEAALEQNNFDNPYLLQRYRAGTVFKSFSARFCPPSWPSVTVGFVPSSQYTLVGDELFQTWYQALQAGLQHQYAVGEAKGSSSLLFHRFYSDSRDSGFVFYEARSFYLGQVFLFPAYTASVSAAHTASGSNRQEVLQLGLEGKAGKGVTCGGGIKLVSAEGVKVGFHASLGLALHRLGDLSARLDRDFLPAPKQQLVANELYTIGFTRYFK
ncbi:hypothetical protein V9K67_24350 [Paraflavisolibacter sp. H34]|uniref:hypothetical protein n=1 Tax=Huijunlia imazamoxiresistens TaxID=3127457 RepID=UPI0030172E1C